MRLLLFSDLHLDAPFRWAGRELARRRRRALRDALWRIVRLADELRVDALCCAGDLYEHDRFTPDTGQFLAAAFGEFDRPVLLTPGNHDWYGPASLYAAVAWPGNVHVFSDDRLAPYELAAGFVVFGAAHRAPAHTPGFLDGFRAGVACGDVAVGLFHGAERGGLRFEASGKQPHSPFTAEQVPRAGLRHALVGHYHTPCDGKWHTYPGNPELLTFDESGPRGAVLVEFDARGGLQRTRHSVATTTVSDVALAVDGVRHSGEIRQRAADLLADQHGLVRLTLTGQLPNSVHLDLDDLNELGPHLDGLLVRAGDLRPALDVAALAAEQTVRGQFVRDVLAAELDPDLRQRVLVTGLRALDGHDELAPDELQADELAAV